MNIKADLSILDIIGHLLIWVLLTIITLGIALFFIAIDKRTGQSILWVLHVGVFGQDPQGDDPEFDPLSQKVVTHSLLLFEVIMMVVGLVLLNLLIAIMTNTYETVNRVAELEARYQKGRLILDIEQFDLPTWMNWVRLDFGTLFPTWLQLLVPVGMIEASIEGAELYVG